MIEWNELQDIPLIDTHVHRFHPNRCGDFGTVAGGYIPGPDQQIHSRQTLLYRMVIEQLRKRFAMPETASPEEIEAERHRRYQLDPHGYSHDLLRDQNVAMYCLDIGSPMGGAPYTNAEIADFHKAIPPEKCCDIVRIDRTVEDLWPEELSFEQFRIRYHESLRREIQSHKTVGIKSCCAYNGGLNVKINSREEAEKSYEAMRAGDMGVAARKPFYDFLLMESVEEAVEYDLPIQIHTGAGGGQFLDFRTENPVNLIDFLQDPRVKNRCKIVLLHGGHPHEEDTGYITAQFSNVYTDFSGTFYLVSGKGVERMIALLERTPLNKVMYGSDGVGMPELSWFAHDHFRVQLRKMLNQLIAEGYMTAARARETSRMIMYDNALGCYHKIEKYL